MPKKLKTAILILAGALPVVVQGQIHVGPQVPTPAGIEVPRDGVTVPMQNMGGQPVVEIKINGKGPYRFILDTGAVTTVVSDELSRELSLTPPAGVQVASVGGGPAPAIVVIHDLLIGDARLEGMIAAVMPLGGLLNGEDAPRGILSAANFRGCLLTSTIPASESRLREEPWKPPIPEAFFNTLKIKSCPQFPRALPVMTHRFTWTPAPPLVWSCR